MASSPSLMERLTKEIECSFCIEIYTDPKTLPCLHTFCLHCLNRLAEGRVNKEPIVCPDCRTEIALPEGGNFNAFPSSFYVNRLRDIVSAQNEDHQVLCTSCNKKSTATAFCFNCECFICEECRELHSRIKIMKAHCITVLSEIQDADVQEILGRPQLCEEARHTTEVLEFFCETCQRCICQKCAIMTHKNHEFVHVDDAADQAKLRLEESKKKVQGGVRTCEEQLKKNQEEHREFEEQIAAAEISAQLNTQRFIDLAKQHERVVMTKLATIREDQGREFEGQKEKLELGLGQLSSVTDYLDSVLKRGISGEILRAEPSVGNRSEELLKSLEELQPVRKQNVKYMPDEDVYHSVERATLGVVVVAQVADPEKTQIEGFEKRSIFINDYAQFTVVTRDNEGNVCHSASEEVTVQILSPAGDDVKNEVLDREDGSYSVSFTPKIEGVHHVTVKVQGKSRATCHVDVNVKRRIPHSYKNLSSFGSRGSGDGQFQYPLDISVSSTGEMAVSDCNNVRVQIFSDTGQFLRKFGTKGAGNRQFQYPTGVAYNKTGNIVLGVRNNSRIEVFSPTGQWIRKVGEEVLKGHCSVSVTNDNNVVACDATVEKVFVFSPEGRLLLQFAENQVSFGNPYAIFQDGKYFVSTGQRVVRVFDSQGARLYDIGKGQLSSPSGLAVDTNNLLLVCDQGNHSVQVFTLEGKFVTSFGSTGSGQGQLCHPYGITITPDGRVFVCDGYNHRIQVFQPQY